jgi:hypothetical protein
MQLEVEGDNGEDSWWFFLFFCFYECVWLFDASNGVEGICACIVSSVQHDMWANLSTLCFYGFLAMAKLVEGLMVESKEGAQKGEDKRLDVVRV